MTGKYIVAFGLFLLSFQTVISQTGTLTGQKSDGSPIKKDSVIGYTDLCTFSLFPSVNDEFRESTWYISIHQIQSQNKSAVKYAEISDTDQYTFSFSRLFQENGWPQKSEGYFWETDPETGLVYADIVCEVRNNKGEQVKYFLPVNLKLAPEKPILNVLKMNEVEPGNYDISIEVYLPSTSSPIQGKWKIKVIAEWIVNYYFDGTFSFDNAYFLNEGDGFIIRGQNDFGSTETDFIDPRTYYLFIEKVNIYKAPFIFPNPVHNTVYLHTEGNENYVSEIIISDSTGKRMIQEAGRIQETISIDVAALSSGLYFLQIKEKSGVKRILRFLKV